MILLREPLTDSDRAYWASRDIPLAEVARTEPGRDELDVCEHPASAAAWAHLERRVP